MDARTARRMGVIALLALALIAAVGLPVQASDSIRVTSFYDDFEANGNCSLREAILAAKSDQSVDACTPGRGADTIQLSAGTYTLSREGRLEDDSRTGDLDLGSNITIVGAGPDQTIIDAGRIDRVVHVLWGGEVALVDLALVNGAAEPMGGPGTNNEYGGGILNEGTLKLEKVRLEDNISNAWFGYGGGIANYGQLTLHTSVLRNNRVEFDGVAAGIANWGQLLADGTLFDGNSTWEYAGMYNASGGVTTLLNSQFINQVCSGDGDVVGNDGEMTLTNVTFSENTCNPRNVINRGTLTELAGPGKGSRVFLARIGR